MKVVTGRERDGSGHLDRFVRDHLPPPELRPDLLLDDPVDRCPDRLNAAAWLLGAGRPGDPALVGIDGVWTYGELRDRVDRIAGVLAGQLGLVPGGRVLLRAVNSPMAAACWLAVLKAGGIAVPTMPLLRARELGQVIDKARIGLAIAEDALAGDLETAARTAARTTAAPCRIVCFTELSHAMERQPGSFPVADTAADDPAVIAFTSGTTGAPKAAVHFHRDLVAVTRGLPPLFGPRRGDVFCGSPSIAFTYGLGALVLFPLAAGAASILCPQSPDVLLDMARRHGATLMFAVPRAYRTLLDRLEHPWPSLRACFSAGEALPLRLYGDWAEATGLPLLDTVGSTEMLHTFIATPPETPMPGATGKVLHGYRAMIVGDDFEPLESGAVGRLVVRGPVGCRYLDDERQANYVRHGWNVTGDAFVVDDEGWFRYRGRTDDLIVSAGYNISAVEVEDVLLEHEAVLESAVVAAPDPVRGTIVKAFIVPAKGVSIDAALAEKLQAWVKERIAPYKYPRAVEFIEALPRTGTGKLQRYKLREQAGPGDEHG
ncbi:MAG TPA: AMP-binding protein [Arenibaculum sp.]|nr:AMP-binding protein [Arenibaculum sp.]